MRGSTDMEVPRSRRRSSSYITVKSSDTPSSSSGGLSGPSKMMKIAIAGTNGFAQYLAYYIESTTPYQFIFLSRRANEGLARKNWQVVTTNYGAGSDLEYLLTGVDVVISTISGSAQIALIEAAANAAVSRFVPSEFCGSPNLRSSDDPADNGRGEALQKLRELEAQSRLRFTVFSCGLFYERFAPGGLAASQLNINESLGCEGDLLVDMRNCQAVLPFPDNSIYVSMTSARDAARCVVAALTLPDWPRQFTFQGERLSLADLFNACQRVRGRAIQWSTCDTTSLSLWLRRAKATQNKRDEVRWFQMLAIAAGQYDFPDPNLPLMVNVGCEGFEEWLAAAWSSPR